MLEIVKPFSSDPAIFKIRLKLFFMAGFFHVFRHNVLCCRISHGGDFKKYQIPSIPGYFSLIPLNKPTNKTPKNLFFSYLIPQLKSYIIWLNLNINVLSPGIYQPVPAANVFRSNNPKKKKKKKNDLTIIEFTTKSVPLANAPFQIQENKVIWS